MVTTDPVITYIERLAAGPEASYDGPDEEPLKYSRSVLKIRGL